MNFARVITNAMRRGLPGAPASSSDAQALAALMAADAAHAEMVARWRFQREILNQRRARLDATGYYEGAN